MATVTEAGADHVSPVLQPINANSEPEPPADDEALQPKYFEQPPEIVLIKSSMAREADEDGTQAGEDAVAGPNDVSNELNGLESVEEVSTSEESDGSAEGLSAPSSGSDKEDISAHPIDVAEESHPETAPAEDTAPYVAEGLADEPADVAPATIAAEEPQDAPCERAEEHEPLSAEASEAPQDVPEEDGSGSAADMEESSGVDAPSLPSAEGGTEAGHLTQEAVTGSDAGHEEGRAGAVAESDAVAPSLSVLDSAASGAEAEAEAEVEAGQQESAEPLTSGEDQVYDPAMMEEHAAEPVAVPQVDQVEEREDEVSHEPALTNEDVPTVEETQEVDVPAAEVLATETSAVDEPAEEPVQEEAAAEPEEPATFHPESFSAPEEVEAEEAAVVEPESVAAAEEVVADEPAVSQPELTPAAAETAEETPVPEAEPAIVSEEAETEEAAPSQVEPTDDLSAEEQAGSESEPVAVAEADELVAEEPPASQEEPAEEVTAEEPPASQEEEEPAALVAEEEVEVEEAPVPEPEPEAEPAPAVEEDEAEVELEAEEAPVSQPEPVPGAEEALEEEASGPAPEEPVAATEDEEPAVLQAEAVPAAEEVEVEAEESVVPQPEDVPVAEEAEVEEPAVAEPELVAAEDVDLKEAAPAIEETQPEETAVLEAELVAELEEPVASRPEAVPAGEETQPEESAIAEPELEEPVASEPELLPADDEIALEESPASQEEIAIVVPEEPAAEEFTELVSEVAPEAQLEETAEATPEAVEEPAADEISVAEETVPTIEVVAEDAENGTTDASDPVSGALSDAGYTIAVEAPTPNAQQPLELGEDYDSVPSIETSVAKAVEEIGTPTAEDADIITPVAAATPEPEEEEAAIPEADTEVEVVPEVAEVEVVPEVAEVEVVPEAAEAEFVPEVAEVEVVPEVSELEASPEVAEPEAAEPEAEESQAEEPVAEAAESQPIPAEIEPETLELKAEEPQEEEIKDTEPIAAVEAEVAEDDAVDAQQSEPITVDELIAVEEQPAEEAEAPVESELAVPVATEETAAEEPSVPELEQVLDEDAPAPAEQPIADEPEITQEASEPIDAEPTVQDVDEVALEAEAEEEQPATEAAEPEPEASAHEEDSNALAEAVTAAAIAAPAVAAAVISEVTPESAEEPEQAEEAPVVEPVVESAVDEVTAEAAVEAVPEEIEETAPVDADEEALARSQSLQVAAEVGRPSSPWTPSYSVTTLHGSSAADEATEVVEVEEAPAEVPTPEIAVHETEASSSSSDAVGSEATEALTADTAATTAASPDDAPPKSPWTPSYSVTTMGNGLQAGDVPEEIETLPPSVVAEDEPVVDEPAETAPAVEETEPEIVQASEPAVEDEAPESEAAEIEQPSEITLVEEEASAQQEAEISAEAPSILVDEAPAEVAEEQEDKPKAPWTPSYSVSRQGSKDNLAAAAATVAGATTAIFDAQVVDTPPSQQSESVTPEPVQESATVDEPQVEAPPAIVKYESGGATPSIHVDDSLVINEVQAPERPKSPWTPSYSVSRQGSADNLPAAPTEAETEPVVAEEQTAEPQAELEAALVAEPVSIDTAAGALSTPQKEVEEGPKSPWTPSYSVTRQGSALVADEDIKEIEQLPEAVAPVADAPKTEEPASAEGPAPPPALIVTSESAEGTENGLDDAEYPFPIKNLDEVRPLSDKSNAGGLAPVDENEIIASAQGDTYTSSSLRIDIPATPSRKRHESTTSSRFFPGGWFSSSPKVPEESRASLDVASGEFAKSPETAPATALPTAVEQDEEKKTRFCTIM